MPYISLGTSSELQIQVPTRGTTNWEEVLRENCFKPIAEHDHTGSGKGSQITETALADDAVTDAKRADFISSGQVTLLGGVGSATDTTIINISTGDVVRVNYSLTENAQTYAAYGSMLITLDAAGNMDIASVSGYTSGAVVDLGANFTVDGGLLKYTTGASGTITMKYKVFKAV